MFFLVFVFGFLILFFLVFFGFFGIVFCFFGIVFGFFVLFLFGCFNRFLVLLELGFAAAPVQPAPLRHKLESFIL